MTNSTSPKERPILFSGPMVRAILAGDKTQTRRALGPQPEHAQVHAWKGKAVYDRSYRTWCWKGYAHPDTWTTPTAALGHLCPYGQPGDSLYVRETWNITHKQALAPGEKIGKTSDECARSNGGFACACADGVVFAADLIASHPKHGKALWRPSIHMPRWASRITLEITDVRVERLNDISNDDAQAEGIFCDWCNDRGWVRSGPDAEQCANPICGDSIPMFREIWDSINGTKKTKTGRTSLRDSWLANPWVWVISFRRIDKVDN